MFVDTRIVVLKSREKQNIATKTVAMFLKVNKCYESL